MNYVICAVGLVSAYVAGHQAVKNNRKNMLVSIAISALAFGFLFNMIIR